MLKITLKLLISIAIVSCSNVATINKKEHKFGSSPDQIIWLQIAGLELEHLALLRFNRSDSTNLLRMENATCSGAAWSYNLYDLRPNSFNSFLGQTLGSLNITNECKDLDKKPLWSYLENFDYKTAILESGSHNKNSLSTYSKCEQFDQFMSKASIIKMVGDSKKSSLFHFQETTQLEEGKVYFDKSCTGSRCLSSLYSNAVSIWENILKKKMRKILIVRDFSYVDSLKRGDVSQAREILTEIERLYSYFSQKKSKDQLLLVTSAEPLKLNFPKQGQKWLGFINSKNSMVRRSSLISPVLAEGSKAENFCGVFNESEVIQRILWSPEKKSVFDNLFKN